MDAAVEDLREHGWVVLRSAVDPALYDPLFDEVARLVGTAPNPTIGDGPRRWSERNGWDDRWLDPILRTRSFWRIVSSPEVTDLFVPFLGEVISYQDNGHLRCYPPRPLERLPWHQDAQFYGVGTELAVRQMLTAWLPLVDAAFDAGCLAVVTGSHRWGLLPGAVPSDTNVRHSTPAQQEQIYDGNRARVQYEPVTLVPMRSGDVLLFSSLLVHTGTENRTSSDRWSLDLRFEAPLGSRPVTAEEEEGLRLMHRRLAGRGSRPLAVRRHDGPQPFEAWQEPAAAGRP